MNTGCAVRNRMGLRGGVGLTAQGVVQSAIDEPLNEASENQP